MWRSARVAIVRLRQQFLLEHDLARAELADQFKSILVELNRVKFAGGTTDQERESRGVVSFNN